MDTIQSLLIDAERGLVDKLGWPVWALRTIYCLSALLGLISLFDSAVLLFQRDGSSGKTSRKDGAPPFTMEFRLFQLQYLAVYLIIMLADWLQGTNMYTLYSSYGVNVGTLFLTGFLSSAVFGTFLGIYVDAWGRKLGCIIFCALEILINLLEHIPNMPLLMVGRIMGGLSTSLLFTAFESWMVSEHRKRGFHEDWLSSTFSIASWGNGIVAILAGLLAQISADIAGDIGPFQLAIGLTVVALVLICFWRENYGSSHVQNADNSSDNDNSSSSSLESGSTVSMLRQMRASVDIIIEQPAIMFLGLSQAFFEGAVYTFVFVWVPSMLQVTDGALPTGLIFSAFMLSMTIGGMLFGLLLPIFPGGAEGLCLLIYSLAAMSMAVPVWRFDFVPVLVSFLVLEAMVGMFNSCGGTLRSKYYPEGLQSSVMSVFRLPLNVLVVLGTKLSDHAGGDVQWLRIVFSVLVGMHIVALLLQCFLSAAAATRAKSKRQQDKKKK